MFSLAIGFYHQFAENSYSLSNSFSCLGFSMGLLLLITQLFFNPFLALFLLADERHLVEFCLPNIWLLKIDLFHICTYFKKFLLVSICSLKWLLVLLVLLASLSLQLPIFLSLHTPLVIARPPYSPGKGEFTICPFPQLTVQDACSTVSQ